VAHEPLLCGHRYPDPNPWWRMAFQRGKSKTATLNNISTLYISINHLKLFSGTFNKKELKK
jgi:hypothetical protein